MAPPQARGAALSLCIWAASSSGVAAFVPTPISSTALSSTSSGAAATVLAATAGREGCAGTRRSWSSGSGSSILSHQCNSRSGDGPGRRVNKVGTCGIGSGGRLEGGRGTVACASSAAEPSAVRLSTPSARPNTLNELLEDREGVSQRFIFFGGKGGVGKTSASAAAAVRCADAGLTTLIISTDPAHSLGDALDEDVGGGQPVRVSGMENLWGMEVDAEAALAGFAKQMEAFDIAAMAAEAGIPQDMVSNLGLGEFSSLISNPPPGTDELVALAGVVKLAKSEQYNFDRIIIDTAPTGHTLRLLSFPDFLDDFLTKVIALRGRMQGLLSMVNTFTGGQGNMMERIDEAVEKIGGFRDEMVELRTLFRTQDVTEFCVVTISTQLAIAESQRLVTALKEQDIAVNHVIVNQLVSPDATQQYMDRINKGQEMCVGRLDAIRDKDGGKLMVSKIPYFDIEVTGVHPLRFMSEAGFGGENAANWADLVASEDRKFVILGGKGGVGKTSSSSALAVKMADEGHNTVIVSTDPAHSLGDALQLDLGSGKLVKVPGIQGEGQLYALEVDTAAAIQEFKDVVDAYLKANQASSDGEAGAEGVLSGLNLGDFANVLDNAPPGTDELVALSKVMNLVRGKNELNMEFDRVIIDTAPTGHTLRMLSYPEFLDDFFEKLIRVRNKFKGLSSMMSMFSGGGGAKEASKTSEEVEAEKANIDKLRSFQFKMMELQELFQDEEQTEFVVVTIPSILAVAESERLVKSLLEQEVPVKHMIVNRIVSPDTKEGYLDRLTQGQANGLVQLREISTKENVALTEVPFFDTEVRNIYGLRAMSKLMFTEE